jgi:uncharacterized protein DUF3850
VSFAPIPARVHDLKSWPEFFRDVLEGKKNHEYRLNDRGYRVGDVLRLREYDPMARAYTGRSVDRSVTYVCDLSRVGGGNYVVLELSRGIAGSYVAGDSP